MKTQYERIHGWESYDCIAGQVIQENQEILIIYPNKKHEVSRLHVITKASHPGNMESTFNVDGVCQISLNGMLIKISLEELNRGGAIILSVDSKTFRKI